MQLFSFAPEKSSVSIKIAFAYSPKNIDNDVTDRRTTGLLYIVKGEYQYSYEGGSFRAGENSVVYLPPYARYHYQVFPGADAPAESMQIEFWLTDSETRKPIAYSEHPSFAFTDTTGAVRSAFKKVIQSNLRTDPPSRLDTFSNIYRLLSLCAENTAASVLAYSRQIMPAVSYLQNNYAKPTPVGELAGLCCLSESQFRRLFRAAFGKSVVAYKSELLLKAARNLLELGEYNISEIADILGFRDVYAFSHWFRRVSGVPPSRSGV